jgi:hypothetical protein
VTIFSGPKKRKVPLVTVVPQRSLRIKDYSRYIYEEWLISSVVYILKL